MAIWNLFQKNKGKDEAEAKKAAAASKPAEGKPAVNAGAKPAPAAKPAQPKAAPAKAPAARPATPAKAGAARPQQPLLCGDRGGHPHGL